MDYLYPKRAGDQHAADVAIGTLPLGALSGTTVINRSQPVGLVHLCHLVAILFNMKVMVF
jgi:hypothetical protein